MDLVWVVSLYFILWWLVLFAVLPLGVKSHTEAGSAAAPGHDPGAPVNPNIKKKFLTTSWVTALITALIWAAVTFHWVVLTP